MVDSCPLFPTDVRGLTLIHLMRIRHSMKASFILSKGSIQYGLFFVVKDFSEYAFVAV